MTDRSIRLSADAHANTAGHIWRVCRVAKRAYLAYENAFITVVTRTGAVSNRAYQRALAAVAQKRMQYQANRQAKANDRKQQQAKDAARKAAEAAAAHRHNGKAAIEALRFARAYLDDWYKQGASGSQMNDAVKFASKYLQQARALDPAANITVEGKDGAVTYSQDQLAAEALYLEAALLATDNAHEIQLQSAFDALKKAVTYNPTAPYIHRKIAEVLLKMHRRSDALKAAQFALSLDPSNLDSRKLYDKIDATPSLGVKQPPAGRGFAAVAKLFYAIAFFFCLILPALFLLQGKFGDAIASFLVMGVPALLIGGKFLDWAMSRELFSKAVERNHYSD